MFEWPIAAGRGAAGVSDRTHCVPACSLHLVLKTGEFPAVMNGGKKLPEQQESQDQQDHRARHHGCDQDHVGARWAFWEEMA